MTRDLTGTTVAITGATGTLGHALIAAFAARGATLALVVQDAADAANLRIPGGTDAWAFPADVTDEDAVRQAFEAMTAQFGGLDVLVHAAGGWASSPLAETTLDAWRHMIDLNLTSAFLCVREAMRAMEPRATADRPTRLVLVASRQGADCGAAEQAAYSAAKAGVVRLAESVAAEMKGRMTAHILAPSTLATGPDADGVAPADVADLVVSLCGPAGNLLNGATLRAYGTAAVAA